MFLDYKGKPSWLAVKSEDEMQAAFEVADDSGFPPELLQAMRKREKVLYMHHKGGLCDDPLEAEKALYPATKLVGRKSTYYYSFINNPNAYDIQAGQILSYEAYRQQQAKG